jgi:hypothetical protein
MGLNEKIYMLVMMISRIDMWQVLHISIVQNRSQNNKRMLHPYVNPHHNQVPDKKE